MPYRVIDREGNWIEVEDGQPLPDGCTLRVAFRDSAAAEQRVINDLRKRHGKPPLADAGHTDAERAYDAMKARLGTPKAKRQPKPEDDPWAKRLPKKRMADGWNYRREKPPNAGPWGGLSKRPAGQPDWVRADGSTMPRVGPSGRSPYARQNATDGETAYRRMVDSLSTRWKTHRKGAH